MQKCVVIDLNEGFQGNAETPAVIEHSVMVEGVCQGPGLK